MPKMHQCADEALDLCGVTGPVDALGHSMGGLALLAYAIEGPGRVKRLVLVGTGSGGPAYMGAPGALWNRSHPAFWRMALLGILHILWPRLAPQQMMLNFIRKNWRRASRTPGRFTSSTVATIHSSRSQKLSGGRSVTF
jgi:pimeloyl-ACP methyl ester carboxylesterase